MALGSEQDEFLSLQVSGRPLSCEAWREDLGEEAEALPSDV